MTRHIIDPEFQLKKLGQLFPSIVFTANLELAKEVLPLPADRWLVIPEWGLFSDTPRDALRRVITKIWEIQRFFNYLGGKGIKQLEPTASAYRRIQQQQDGFNTLIVPSRIDAYDGVSIRDARVDIADNEFFLDTFAVAIAILLGVIRIRSGKTIICAGDELSWNDDGNYRYAPYFYNLFGDLGVNGRTYGSHQQDCSFATGIIR